MEYLLKDNILNEVFAKAEEQLFAAKRIKFEKGSKWANLHFPKGSGVYAIFEDGKKLLYIGETGNLQKRIEELNRTVNHSFRKQIGFIRFNGIKTSKKFAEEVEYKINQFYETNLFIAYIEINFGRIEIETYLVSKYQPQLLNSEKKRKTENFKHDKINNHI